MIKKLKTIPTATLGGGYSTDRQMPVVEPCLTISNASIVYSDGSKSTLNLGNTQTFLEIQGALGVAVGLQAGLALFSNDISAIYARDIQDDLYTQSFYFSESIALPVQIFYPQSYGTSALNGFGQGVYNAGLDTFRNICGDQFIHQIHLGASLFVTFQVLFASLSDKQSFQANVDSSGFAGLIDTSTTVQAIINTYHIKGSVNLLAYQNGGNPGELAQIFTNNTNGYYITSCDLSNLQPCQNVVDGVLDYAVNNFSNQVNITNGQIIGNAYPVGYTYYPYTMVGLNSSNSIITADIEQARATLGELYYELQSQNTFVSHLISSAVFTYMPADIQQNLQATEANITANINTIEDPNTGGINCYNDPTNCFATLESILQNQVFLNSTFINEFSKAYDMRYGLQWIIDNSSPIKDQPNFNAFGLPLGNGNYIKFGTSFGEKFQISITNQSMYVNDGSLSVAINATYYGYAGLYPETCPGENGICTMTIYEIDNPI